MKVSFFLHAYQPTTQFSEITEKITEESYAPIVKLLKESSSAKATLNWSGSLVEQLLRNGNKEIIQDISLLLENGKMEVVDTAIYHPLLAKLPEEEIIRQIRLNNKLNSSVFGSKYLPKGVFIPEMFYTRHVAEAIDKLDYSWIVLDESAFPGAGVSEKGLHDRLQINRSLYQVEGLSLSVFFRNRPVSSEVAFNEKLTVDRLMDLLIDEFLNAQESYAIIAVDAETFGHHHKDKIKFLREAFEHPNIEPVTVSELLLLDLPTRSVDPLDSTWGLGREDIEHRRVFPRWDNPDNPLHQMMWSLFELALRVGEHKGEDPDDFDRSLHSDSFWWASHNPCWHPGMIDKGVSLLEKTILESTRSTEEEKQEARRLHSEIINQGKILFGDSVID